MCNDLGGQEARRIPPGRPEGRPRRGPGPTARAGPRPAAAAAIPFLFFSPLPHRGREGDTTRNAAQRPPLLLLLRAASPPGDIRGRSGPEGGHDARPIRAGGPGPSPAEPAAGMTRTRGGPAAGAGRHRKGGAVEYRGTVARPASDVRPRQRVFSPPESCSPGTSTAKRGSWRMIASLRRSSPGCSRPVCSNGTENWNSRGQTSVGVLFLSSRGDPTSLARTKRYPSKGAMSRVKGTHHAPHWGWFVAIGPAHETDKTAKVRQPDQGDTKQAVHDLARRDPA